LTGDICYFHPCNGCDYDDDNCGTETTPCPVLDGDFDCNAWEKINKLNHDDKLRQSIIGIEATYKRGGTEQFYNLTLKKLLKLIEYKFVDLDETQNNSPPIREFLELLKKYPDENVTLHGYIVSPERDDYRVSIEGLTGRSNNRLFCDDFDKLNKRYPFGTFINESYHQYSWYD